MREDGELRRLMHENVLDGRWEQALPIVERGKWRGELPESTDARLLMEVASALVYQRVLVHGAPVDEPFVVHCVDDVLLPLLRDGSPWTGQTRQRMAHSMAVRVGLGFAGVLVRMLEIDGAIRRAFDARVCIAVVLATAVGAFNPFCSCTVIPLVAGLLVAGVPLAPAMAFCV